MTENEKLSIWDQLRKNLESPTNSGAQVYQQFPHKSFNYTYLLSNKYSCCISFSPDLTTDSETTDFELVTNLLTNQFHELRIYLVQLWLFTYFDNRWRCSRFMAKAGRFGLLSSNELKFGNHLLMEYVRKYLFFNIMSFYINFEWKLCHIL